MITCKVTGLIYIGKTSNSYARSRWRVHIQQAKNGQQTKLHVAMREHGVDAFEWVPIAAALPPVKSGYGNLDALEKILIEQYGSDVTGYNVIGPSYNPPHYFKRKAA